MYPIKSLDKVMMQQFAGLPVLRIAGATTKKDQTPFVMIDGRPWKAIGQNGCPRRRKEWSVSEGRKPLDLPLKQSTSVEVLGVVSSP